MKIVGLTKNSIKFDGIDDYVKIKYDDTVVNDDGLTKKEILAQNGFTFEFYGKLNSWNDGTETKIVDGVYRTGLFCFCKSNSTTLRDVGIRCFLDKDLEGNFFYTWSASWVVGSMTGDEYYSDYADEKAKHIVKYPLNDDVLEKINNKKDVYLTFTFDVTDEVEIGGISYVKAKVYEDGNEILDAKYCKGAWTDFLKSYRWTEGEEFEIGRVMAGNDGNWVYSNMDCYALRLYNRALNKNEVEESCRATKDYLQALKN